MFGLHCPQPIQDGIQAAAEFTSGAAAQYYYNNSFGLLTTLEANPGESTAMTAGRVLGDVLTIAQGTGEISEGGAMIGGSVAACGSSGVGCVAVAPASAIGGGLIAHGSALGLQGTTQLAENGQVLFAKIAPSESDTPQIHWGKQGKHIVGHNNYQEGRSILTHNDPQSLIDEFAGTGNRLPGKSGHKEWVNFDQEIGIYIKDGINYGSTTNGVIHYSKSGVHIIPAAP